MAHQIPIGTRLLLTLPFTPELLDGDEYEPFCPGITGTVECWIIGHDPHVPDRHGYLHMDPEYTICPYKTHKMGGWPMWEFLARSDVEPTLFGDFESSVKVLSLLSHNLARNIPERLLLPFIQKD